MDTDLSATDLTFLRTIRDINLNPGEYEATEGGEKPANTTSVRKASPLSRSQINYRLGSNRNRYFGEDGLGFVEVHPAKINEETGGFGPKSMELTEKGVEALSNHTGGDSSRQGDRHPTSEIDTTGESEAIRQLHAKIESLEKRSQEGGGSVDAGQWESEVQQNSEAIQRVEAKLDELIAELRAVRDSEWGGVGDEKAENLDRILNRAPAMMYAFTVLLEIDIDEIVDVGGYSPDEADEIRSRLYTLLESSVDTGSDESVRKTGPSGEDESVDVDESGGVNGQTDPNGSTTQAPEHEPPSFANTE